MIAYAGIINEAGSFIAKVEIDPRNKYNTPISFKVLKGPAIYVGKNLTAPTPEKARQKLKDFLLHELQMLEFTKQTYNWGESK